VLYFQTFKIGLQNALVYRWNFFLRLVFGFFPLIGSYFLWTTVFANEQSVGGYELHEMISYFVAMLVLDALTASTDDDFRIAYDIRHGVLNQSLLKPMNYCLYQFSVYGATRLVYALTAILPLMVVVIFLANYVIIPNSFEAFVLTYLSILGSAFIQFLISLCIGLMAFWLLEISALSFSIFGLEYLLGGHIFPLDILPQDIYRIALMLPFSYEYYVPVAIWTGRLSGTEAWHCLATQWMWVLVLAAISQVIWATGIRKYTAVGG